MAVVATPPPRMSVMRDEHVMDTRTPSPSPVQRTNSGDNASGSGNNAQYKPDLSAEVALLSTKLVNAINYQTNLDDSLQQTRHELQQARQQLARVQAEKKHVDDMLAAGTLVQKVETDKALARLRAELVLERAAKEAAEKAKKQTEGELENLTSALFEEANTMVAAARKDAEAVERRNAQLRSQLEDTELLLASQQEQLQDLKATMERQQKEGQAFRDPSTPSTPVNTLGASIHDATQPSPTTSSIAENSPEHPLFFSSLIMPVLRSDTTAFGEFQDLLVLARRLGAHSRTNSNNSTHNSSAVNSSIFPSANSSSPNVPGSFSLSANSSPSSTMYSSNSNIPPLKESKFYKRVLTEDIEPTLRLDLAPGLSFLSRRTVVGSLLQGTLAVEPFPQNKHYYACALCGESRRTELHVRRHRFKTSEDDTVPKPVCDYCVARVRTTADFVGFLRVVRDGHWKCDSEDDHRAAWEESVRLRERMFWARAGGGVVPCFQPLLAKNIPQSPATMAANKSARQSLESIPETQSLHVEKRSTVIRDAAVDAQESSDTDEPSAGIARAIVNMSSGAAVHAVPNIEPAQEPSVSPSLEHSEFITPTESLEEAPPARSDVATPEANTKAISSADPVTPPARTITTEQTPPTQSASEVPSPETIIPVTSSLAAEMPPAQPAESSDLPASIDSDSAPQISLPSSNRGSVASRSSSATRDSVRSSSTAAADRKSSGGVQARIRAMEAKAQESSASN